MSLANQHETSDLPGEANASMGNLIDGKKDLEETNSPGTFQYITFTVNKEEYGIDIMSVLEIKGWTETTRLPNQPDYLRGVLNLRGAIVPIIDLRHRFGGGHTEASSINVVIIVSIEGRYIGILVDAVSDILTVSKNDIQEVPNVDGSSRENFLSGLVTLNDRMVAILELSQLRAGTDIDIEDLSKNSDEEN
ncbi:MAG: chemotaxis protein CheW [Methyloligellaceae bacterium]